MADANQTSLWDASPAEQVEAPVDRQRRQARQRARRYRRRHGAFGFAGVEGEARQAAPPAAVVEDLARALGEALAEEFRRETATEERRRKVR